MSEEKHTHVHVLEDGTVIEHSHDHAHGHHHTCLLYTSDAADD